MARAFSVLKGSGAKSAAAKLGGKMYKKTLCLPITNVYGVGDYTATVYVGSECTPANVILDTGSSTLAIQHSSYKLKKDRNAKTTNYAQEVVYTDQTGWRGAVVKTSLTVGRGKNAITQDRVSLAVTYYKKGKVFGKSDGILGLAYTKLNDAHKMPHDPLVKKYTLWLNKKRGTKVRIKPYFTQLEESGKVPNKFSFYTRRSAVNWSRKHPEKNELNHGYFILGGGEEYTGLYEGPFQVARVVADDYYNVHMKQIIVGEEDPIHVPPPLPGYDNISNAIVDSGTQVLDLPLELFDEIAHRLRSKRLARMIRRNSVPMEELNLSEWPTIVLVLEGALGEDVRLELTPDTYWQTNSPGLGLAAPALSGSPQMGGQTILGLPLMNNYFTVFDRSTNRGKGVVSFAKIKKR